MLERLKLETNLLKLPAAEIGVAEGRFSLDLLSLGVPKLYMVDVWQRCPDLKGDAAFSQQWHDNNYNLAKQKVAKFGDKAVFLRGRSVEMSMRVPNNSLGFVFIDAAHDYKSVLEDLVAWYPKVVKGGLITGHDYLNQSYGVYKSVADFLLQHAGFEKHTGTTVETIGAGENACFCFKAGGMPDHNEN